MDLKIRFFTKVEKTSGCWLWIGATDRTGYGSFWDGARLVPAHRMSWRLHYGAIPNGLKVLHTCDTPKCVNPEHLFLGTQKVNVADMIAKGRGRFRGEDSGRTRLTKADVDAIRAHRDEPHSQLAERYGMSIGGIRKIIYSTRWK